MIERLTLLFEPLDVLQFRDYRPFDAGFNFFGQSRFPLPAVFLGCLRTALFRASGAHFGSPDEHFDVKQPWARALLGGRSRAGELRLRGPLLARLGAGSRPEPLFPAPHDLVEVEGAYRVLQPLELNALSADLAPARFHWTGREVEPASRPLAWTPGRAEKPGEGFLLLRPEAARTYAQAGSAPIAFRDEDLVSSRSVILHEDRLGIARDPESLTADEHMLYLRRPFRLAAGTGFAVDAEIPAEHAADARSALQGLDGAVVPLGGKGHRARVRVFEGSLLPEDLDAEGPASPRAKLWLLTPAVLPDAWPSAVVGLVADRAVAVGGYDLARHAPRALRRALPAGAVVHVDGLTRAQAAQAVCPSEDDLRAGYGTALLLSR